jgi:hypothetical protein
MGWACNTNEGEEECIYSAFNDRGNPATPHVGDDISHISLL